MQPALLYVIVTLLVAIPLTFPGAATVAFVVLLLLQEPPTVVSLSVITLPVQTEVGPEMAAGLRVLTTTELFL